MINFKDGKISEEEKELFYKEVLEKREDYIINQMDKKELSQIKEKIIDKEIDFDKEKEKNKYGK